MRHMRQFTAPDPVQRLTLPQEYSPSSKAGSPRTVPWRHQATRARLKDTVTFLCGAVHPRDHRHPQNLLHALEYVEERWRRAGLSTVVQPLRYAQRPYANLVALAGDPAAGQAPLVVGAHVDALMGTPGADDNASGVAVLLELGLRWAKTPPSMPVQLVLWTLEEEPCFGTPHMGSVHHAQWLLEQGIRPRLVVCLDMVGTYSHAPRSQRYPWAPMGWVWPPQGNFLAVAGTVTRHARLSHLARSLTRPELPFVAMSAPRFVPGVTWSDHRSYWATGVEAVLITDTAFYRNPRYHGPWDTPDTLDFPTMAVAVDSLQNLPQTLGAPPTGVRRWLRF